MITYFENEIIKKALYLSGWNEKRNINIDEIKTTLISEGYTVFDCVTNFLRCFGNLIIHFKNLKNGQLDDINFFIDHAIQVENSERILQDYSLRIGKKCCLIGSAYRDHFCLIMCEDGEVYGGYSDYLYKISNSGEAAIEAIILDYNFIEIK